MAEHIDFAALNRRAGTLSAAELAVVAELLGWSRSAARERAGECGGEYVKPGRPPLTVPAVLGRGDARRILAALAAEDDGGGE